MPSITVEVSVAAQMHSNVERDPLHDPEDVLCIVGDVL